MALVCSVVLALLSSSDWPAGLPTESPPPEWQSGVPSDQWLRTGPSSC